MGLLYQFSSDIKDPDHVVINDGSLMLRSYGLPKIFWFYLLAILITLAFLYMASYSSLLKLKELDTDTTNQLFVLIIFLSMIILPITLIGFFFYEKNIIKNDNQLKIIHRVFFLKIKIQKYQLKHQKSFFINHYLDSPNMARLSSDSTSNAFENRGYFELWAELIDGKNIRIDRSSQKNNLKNIMSLLCAY